MFSSSFCLIILRESEAFSEVLAVLDDVAGFEVVAVFEEVSGVVVPLGFVDVVGLELVEG